MNTRRLYAALAFNVTFAGLLLALTRCTWSH